MIMKVDSMTKVQEANQDHKSIDLLSNQISTQEDKNLALSAVEVEDHSNCNSPSNEKQVQSDLGNYKPIKPSML